MIDGTIKLINDHFGVNNFTHEPMMGIYEGTTKDGRSVVVGYANGELEADIYPHGDMSQQEPNDYAFIAYSGLDLYDIDSDLDACIALCEKIDNHETNVSYDGVIADYVEKFGEYSKEEILIPFIAKHITEKDGLWDYN